MISVACGLKTFPITKRAEGYKAKGFEEKNTVADFRMEQKIQRS